MNKPLCKILCIDDHPINGAIIQGIFKNIYDVSVVITGESALQILEKEKFDLILLDIGLPDMSGYEIANILNQKKLPFIFLSAKIGKVDIEKGYEYKPLDYMKKPINGTEIKFQITKHINILQIQHKNEQKIEKLKDDILSIFTHEMNTPLNSILAFSEYITKELAKQEKTPKTNKLQRLSRQIHQNGLKLFDFNQSFIDLASLKYAKYTQMPSEIFSLQELTAFVQSYEECYEPKIDFTLNASNPPKNSKYLLTLLLRNLLLLTLHRQNSFILCTITIEPNGTMLIEIKDDGEELRITNDEDFLANIENICFLNMNYNIGNIWLKNIKYLKNILQINLQLDSSKEKTFLQLKIPAQE